MMNKYLNNITPVPGVADATSGCFLFTPTYAYGDVYIEDFYFTKVSGNFGDKNFDVTETPVDVLFVHHGENNILTKFARASGCLAYSLSNEAICLGVRYFNFIIPNLDIEVDAGSTISFTFLAIPYGQNSGQLYEQYKGIGMGKVTTIPDL